MNAGLSLAALLAEPGTGGLRLIAGPAQAQ